MSGAQNPSRAGASVCLVTPGHLGSNPRVVKEADALTEAGYHVHVISGDSFPAARFRDASVLERAKWSSEIVKLSPDRATYLLRRLVRYFCRWLFAAGLRTPAIAARAHHALVPALKAAAARFPADLYVGHCLAALPAVVSAGQQNAARIGFDAEDFHSGEADDEGRGRLDNAIAATLEGELLPRCHHLTAASPLIAEAYRAQCGVDPLPLLNVFPLREAVEPQSAPEIPSFYWFSQTIGPGRGLEDFAKILRSTKRTLRLELRGHVSDAYQSELQAQTSGSGVELRILPADVPQEMVRRAAGYTAGLSLELRRPRNRDLCLTNKAFTYLLAGVPVILSRTRAQEKLAAELADAALLLDLDDTRGAAIKLNDWLDSPVALCKARTEAHRLGRQRFNWDAEQKLLYAKVEKTLSRGG